MASIALSFGLTNKLSLTTSIPIIINRSVNESLDQTDTDFGNLSIMGRAFFSPRLFSKPANIQMAIGASLPVGGGVTNVDTNERNFASGSVDPIGSLVIALGIAPDWNITTAFFTRQVIVTSSDNRRAGDQYVYGLQAIYAPLARSYSANAGFSFINRGQDEVSETGFANSGGEWVYAKLGGSKTLIGSGESAIRFWSELQFPVYMYVEGTQLTEEWNLRFGFTTGLSLFGHSTKPGDHEHFGTPISEQ